MVMGLQTYVTFCLVTGHKRPSLATGHKQPSLATGHKRPSLETCCSLEEAATRRVSLAKDEAFSIHEVVIYRETRFSFYSSTFPRKLNTKVLLAVEDMKLKALVSI